MGQKFGGRPPQINTNQILQTAISLGFDNVSMNAVARELKVTPAALYRYFESKDALLDACMDHFCKRLVLPAEDQHWRDFLTGLGIAIRRTLNELPGASTYGNRMGPTTPAGFRIVDLSLNLLMDQGFSERDAWSAYVMVLDHVFNYVRKEEEYALLEAQNGPGGYKLMQLQPEELEDLPALAKTLASYGDIDFDYAYERQLRAIIVGIEAEYAPQQAQADQPGKKVD